MIYQRLFFFFFNDTATTEIYTLSLHDALPISLVTFTLVAFMALPAATKVVTMSLVTRPWAMLFTLTVVAVREKRSEEHTSELQSLRHLVCRLLLEKK